MRSALYALFIVFLAQVAVVPLLAAERCAVLETQQHPDDDCSPLCVTCGCSPVSHAFHGETVRDLTLSPDPLITSIVLVEAAPDAPPQEILHVPLG